MGRWPARAGVFALVWFCLSIGTPASGAGPLTPPHYAPLDTLLHSLSLEPKHGLFTLFFDRQTGAIYMEVRASQLNKEFLYTARIESGLADLTGTNELERSSIIENRVFKIVHPQVQPGRLEFIDEQSNYTFDPASTLARAASANSAPEIFASADIIAANADESVYLIRLDQGFDKDAVTHLKRPTTRSRAVAVEPHPFNSDIIIDYFVSGFAVRVRHSLIALEPSNYVPRAYDYRVGYVSIPFTDVTSTAPVPYADVIERWNLEKKDPKAALSEPVTPITFWIENTTPHEYRDAVKQAILAWNAAFETAGFKDAIRVELEPDSPDWTPGDIRHNVVRWISTPVLAYAGETWPIANPRTGEIINATITLDYWQFRELLNENNLFASAAIAERDRAADEPLLALDNLSRPREAPGLALGLETLQSRNADKVEVSRLYLEAVRQTVMHEIGHALGLTHNFMASTLRPFAELQNTDQSRYPLAASVMDYFPVNIARKGKHQGPFYMTAVGPYDKWAVAYGYTPPLANPAAEEARMKALLARSTEPELAFGNDGDATEAGIDPRTMSFDLSADPVAWARDRMELVDETLPELKAKLLKPDESYQELRNTFADLIDEKGSAARILARYIGGVYVDHAAPNQPGAKPPFAPVPEATQKTALATLAAHIFAPDAFSLPAELARYLQMQRRGRDFITYDPDMHAWSFNVQKVVLDRVLSPRVLARITNARTYGGTYSADAFLSDLTDAIFAADMNGNVNTFRQNLQTKYVDRLTRIIVNPTQADTYDPVARAAIFNQIKRIHDEESLRVTLHLVFGMNDETVAFRTHLVYILQTALNVH
ncbi:MAG: zinc-dependent metalloprotease [Alphaproteobacteria bacterium]